MIHRFKQQQQAPPPHPQLVFPPIIEDISCEDNGVESELFIAGVLAIARFTVIISITRKILPIFFIVTSFLFS
jgi:hypothetical protein